MPSFDLQLSKGTTSSKSTLVDGQGYLDTEKGSLTIKIDGITSEFRPGGVGTDAEKPATLKEGESYFASDTYRLYYGGVNGAAPFSVLGFPYYKLVDKFSSTTEKVFRLMVDPDNGDDNFDGLGWDRAKASIQGALNTLPTNMENFDAWILVKPGTYDGGLYFEKYGGNVNFVWIGDWVDVNDDDVSVWMRAGSEDVGAGDGQIVIENTANSNIGSEAGVAHFKGNTNANYVNFYSENMALYYGGIGAWDSADRFYFDRWYFKSEDAPSPHFTVGINTIAFYSDSGITVRPSNSGGVFVAEGGKIELRAYKSTYVNTNACERGTSWDGIFQTRHGKDGFKNTITFNVLTTFKYHSSYAPPTGKRLVVDGATNILGAWGDTSIKTCVIKFPTSSVIDYSDANGGAVKPTIYIGTKLEAGSVIEYHSDSFTLDDNSEVARTIKDLKTSTLTTYISKYIQDPLPTSDPGVAGALWSDSGTVKVSAGT